MTAPTQPGDRPSLRTLLSALAVTGALSALVVCAILAAAPDPVRTPLAWCAGAAVVVLGAAVATAAHALRAARGGRDRLDSVTQDIGRLLQQQARTTEEARREQQRLIDELARQRTELTESFAAESARLEERSAGELERLRRENSRLTDELGRARREGASAVAATSNAAARLQALATATLADLRAMEDRHGDEDVLADLLHLDHRTAQAGRLADSVAVLTGARSGRRWARPIGMESVLRGAMGRIAAYRRVRVHSVSETAVAGHAAEGVMHALAELLDNAANFSPPNAEVHVYVEEVPAGVMVSVEDSGLVMGDVQLRRAERAVSGDVSELGGLTGTRLGLAVVGRLARKHGLKVSFRPSARGGTGVLMLIPQEVLTRAAPAAGAARLPEPETSVREGSGRERPVRPPVAVGAAPGQDPRESPESPEPADSDATTVAEGPAGLPRRRRGRTLAEAERLRSMRRAAEARPAPGADDAQVRTARFSSFRRAVRPIRSDTGPPVEQGASDSRRPISEPSTTRDTASGHQQTTPEPTPLDHGPPMSEPSTPRGTASGHDRTTPPSPVPDHRPFPAEPPAPRRTLTDHRQTPPEPTAPRHTAPEQRTVNSSRDAVPDHRTANPSPDTAPGHRTANPPRGAVFDEPEHSSPTYPEGGPLHDRPDHCR
ncbi:ATP-binding protein [Streptomyces sp. NPDC004561]